MYVRVRVCTYACTCMYYSNGLPSTRNSSLDLTTRPCLQSMACIWRTTDFFRVRIGMHSMHTSHTCMLYTHMYTPVHLTLTLTLTLTPHPNPTCNPHTLQIMATGPSGC